MISLRSLLPIVFATIATSAATASTPTCYCKNSDTIANSCYGGIGAVPCGNSTNGGFVQCCGKGDICGADGFCHYTHPQVLGSGYYIGGCTDPHYKDPVCPQGCTTEPAPDVVFNSATELWACCSGSEGATNCSDPTTDTFQAGSPQVLFATTSISQTTSTTSTSSSSSTSTSTSTSTTPALSASTTAAASSSPLSSSLSPGAIAGIVIGIIIAISIIAAVVILMLRRRRQSHTGDMHSPQEHAHDPNVYNNDTKYTYSENRDYDVLSDKKSRSFASELPNREPSELPGSANTRHNSNPVELEVR